jgi:hypothetical protein
MTTIGIATILTGVLAGGLAITGVISGGVAWSAFGAGMGVAAIFAGLVVVFAVIQGAEERDVSFSLLQIWGIRKNLCGREFRALFPLLRMYRIYGTLLRSSLLQEWICKSSFCVYVC